MILQPSSTATVLNIDPSVVTAFVAVMGMFGVISTFVINSLVENNIRKLLEKMDDRYATKDEMKVALAIRTLDEANHFLKRSHHAGGD